MTQSLPALLESRTLDQLPPTAAITGQTLLPVQEPSGPLQSATVDDLIAVLPSGPANRPTIEALKSAPIAELVSLYDGSVWQRVERAAQSAGMQAAITADALNGLFAISTVDADYAWVRLFNSHPKASWWGVAPLFTNVTNTARLNAAMKVCGLAGYMVPMLDFGLNYFIETVGPHFAWAGHQQALYIEHDGSGLEGHPSGATTLTLKNGQQSDAAGPVEMFTWANNRKYIELRHIHLRGNRAGQAGWTGGFNQNTHGNGFISYGSVGGDAYWTIEDCSSHENFSNSFNLGVGLGNDPANPANWLRKVFVRNLASKNTGEGIQFIRIDGLKFENLGHEQDDGATAGIAGRGDAVEFAECRGQGTGIYVKAIGPCQNSSGVDYYGSEIQAQIIIIDGWQNGFGSSRTGGAYPMSSINCIFGTFTIKNVPAGGTCISAPEGNPNPAAPDALTAGSAIYENGHIINCDGLPFQTSNADLAHMPPLKLHNVNIANCRTPIVNSARPVIWDGGGHRYPKAGEAGLSIGSTDTVPVRDVTLRKVEFIGSTTRNINFDPNHPIEMRGRWTGVECSVDGSLLTPGANVDLTRLTVDTPIFNEVYLTDPVPSVLGVKVLQRYHDVTDIKEGTRGQELTIRASGGTIGSPLVITHSANLQLAGAANFNMVAGNELYLRMVTDDQNVPLGAAGSYWVETGRKV